MNPRIASVQPVVICHLAFSRPHFLFDRDGSTRPSALQGAGKWDRSVKIAGRTPHPGERKSPESRRLFHLFGGAERDRTADLLVANEALSQLSYSPPTRRASHTFRRRNAVEQPLARVPASTRSLNPAPVAANSPTPSPSSPPA